MDFADASCIIIDFENIKKNLCIVWNKMCNKMYKGLIKNSDNMFTFVRDLSKIRTKCQPIYARRAADRLAKPTRQRSRAATSPRSSRYYYDLYLYLYITTIV